MEEQKNYQSDEGLLQTNPEEINIEVAEKEETIRESVEGKKPFDFLRELYEWSQSIAVAMVLALIVNQFIFAMVQVEGGSMLPTLESKERLVVTKLFYKPEAGDIVVVKSHALGKHIIKRVIAVPGDEIELQLETGNVIVNGEVLEEPYIFEKMRYIGSAYNYPIKVPEGYVFVMGDNRNNSQDSRNLGVIAFEDVVGRASLRVTPFSKFGTLYKDLQK